ncbi:MAG: hypothetical protein ABI408_08995 [Gemmatimonadaceae bacterium]
MTDGGATKADAVEIIGEITRRAGHEIRNALSGVAVNVEVVKSRASRADGPADLASFADRAALQVAVASALTDGLLGLVGSVLAAEAKGTLRALPASEAGTRIELTVYGDRASVILSSIRRLADAIGVTVEERAERVILTVLPEGKSHSKV